MYSRRWMMLVIFSRSFLRLFLVHNLSFLCFSKFTHNFFVQLWNSCWPPHPSKMQHFVQLFSRGPLSPRWDLCKPLIGKISLLVRWIILIDVPRFHLKSLILINDRFWHYIDCSIRVGDWHNKSQRRSYRELILKIANKFWLSIFN